VISGIRTTLHHRLRGTPDPRRLVEEGLVLGEDVYIAPGVVIDPWHCWLVEIHDGAVLAPDVYVLAHDASTKAHLGYTKIGEVVIGERAFIGAATMILPDVRIGAEAIIGAGSVVSADVPAGVLAAGNPLQVLGRTDEYVERQRRLLQERPRYGPEYSHLGGVTPERKAEMRDAVRDGIAFIE
jgi:maltose O-acetyltransferase